MEVKRIRVVGLYAAAGLVIGFVFLPLIPLVRALGFPRDSAVGIALFGLMPILIVVVGVLRPRLDVNLLGLLVALITWSLGYMLACMIMGFDLSSIGFSLTIMAPIMVPVYIALSLLAFGVGRFRCAQARGG
jgi:hypothetical protein